MIYLYDKLLDAGRGVEDEQHAKRCEDDVLLDLFLVHGSNVCQSTLHK